MDLNFFNYLDDSQRLWQFYLAFSVLVWGLLWLGIRCWMWWGLKAVLLGVSAGILFSPGATEEGSIAPLFMVLVLELMANPTAVTMSLIQPLLMNAGVASGALLILFFLLRKYLGEPAPLFEGWLGGRRDREESEDIAEQEMKKALKMNHKRSVK